MKFNSLVLQLATALGALATPQDANVSRGLPSGARVACSLLKRRLPSLVHLPGSQEYAQDIFHFDQTSAQNSTCSVTPSSAEDIQEILSIVGRKDIRSPFAVKGGGHSFNPGFSSTPGVQISLSSFKQLSYDRQSQTVRVGAGLTWGEIYAGLDPYGVTAVGGRVPGVGLGLLLGGGYSWLSDQHGLGVDNIVSMDVVLPDGRFITVSDKMRPDVLFALKGGMNNFGIVTSFVLKTYPIGNIWAGVMIYSTDQQDKVIQALADFSLKNTDHKAQLVGVYLHSGNTTLWEVNFFYDGNTPTVFQPFLDIPYEEKNVGITTFNAFSAASAFAPNIGGTFHTVPIINYTVPLLESIVVQCNKAHAKALEDHRSISGLHFVVEPFAGAFSHNTPSAYPHPPNRPVTPSSIWYVFTETKDADYFHDATWDLSNAIQKAAVREGQSRWDDIRYPAYALGDTPLEQLYGHNVPLLKAIRASVDPKRVMDLAGGFRL